MHIFFSGIGGAGIGPLSLIAHQAGFTVSGSDKQHSDYITYLQRHGITNLHIGQTYDQLAAVHKKNPIDWYVYSSAVTKEQGDLPDEIRFCHEHSIKSTRRNALLNEIMFQKQLKMIAIAGTHGKTTTTAMAVWLFQQLGIPESHSVAAKMSFAEMGQYTPGSEYFIYEADEYDQNFLAFDPSMSIITGIDWDHPDVYPTREAYRGAFRQFIGQSERVVLWANDMENLGIGPDQRYTVLQEAEPAINTKLHIPGLVNRMDAWAVAQAVHVMTGERLETLLEHLNRFPGAGRRFEQVAPHIYSDYAHTPPKIRGALQIAEEVASGPVVVVYEGLHNTRQHFIKKELRTLFDDVKKLYIVPSYLAREDTSLQLLSPEALKQLLSPKAQAKTEPAALNDALAARIGKHAAEGDLVLAISAGGGNSLDEWLRRQLAATPED